MKTNEHVHRLGLYRSACCDSESLFLIGERFWRCPRCTQACSWHLSESVFTPEQLEQLEAAAA